MALKKPSVCLTLWVLVIGLVMAGVSEAQEAAPRRAIFVSVLQEPIVLESQKAMKRLVAEAKDSGADTLFVQVYRANRSWFPSRVSDDAPYRECLAKAGTDPLGFLIREAHAAGIEVHAWLNLLSLSANKEASVLKRHGYGILTRNRKHKRSLSDYKIDNQYFLEPGDPRVRRFLSTAVEEVLSAYPELDGIQFDYIRYPDREPAYGHTPVNAVRFLSETGAVSIREEDPAWRNWKRNQVTGLLEQLVAKARATRPGIVVSTTGLMPYVRANLESFQDWRVWIKRDIVDFVTLMCYTKDEARFGRYLKDVRRRLGTLDRANIAVGAYKLTAEPEAFARQWTACEAARPRACAVLDYESLEQNPALYDSLKK